MFNSDVHNRRSIRLPGYDYTSESAYFITIVTKNRKYMFGNVVDCEMRLNNNGYIALEMLKLLETQHEYVSLDSWIIMPNHIHLILVICDDCWGGSRTALKTPAKTSTPKRKPLGRLIGAFKTVSTKKINSQHHTPGLQVWQRNYYEHIIRDESELDWYREYINENPRLWEDDPENL